MSQASWKYIQFFYKYNATIYLNYTSIQGVPKVQKSVCVRNCIRGYKETLHRCRIKSYDPCHTNKDF
jgi:hypothetical protein